MMGSPSVYFAVAAFTAVAICCRCVLTFILVCFHCVIMPVLVFVCVVMCIVRCCLVYSRLQTDNTNEQENKNKYQYRKVCAQHTMFVYTFHIHEPSNLCIHIQTQIPYILSVIVKVWAHALGLHFPSIQYFLHIYLSLYLCCNTHKHIYALAFALVLVARALPHTFNTVFCVVTEIEISTFYIRDTDKSDRRIVHVYIVTCIVWWRH